MTRLTHDSPLLLGIFFTTKLINNKPMIIDLTLQISHRT